MSKKIYFLTDSLFTHNTFLNLIILYSLKKNNSNKNHPECKKNYKKKLKNNKNNNSLTDIPYLNLENIIV